MPCGAEMAARDSINESVEPFSLTFHWLLRLCTATDNAVSYALTQIITKKLGPCGGKGGDAKDMNINGVTRIVKISVRHSSAIDALTISFLRNGVEESTDLWGGQDGKLTEFNLKPSEYITSVKGHIGSYKNWPVVVRSLKFETNLGSFGPYGTEEGVSFELPAIFGQIIGFHGRSHGVLDALGVYVQVSTQVLINKIGPCGGTGGTVKHMNVDGITRIVKISIRHGGAIDALTVRFLRNGREESTEQWGRSGGQLTEFTLRDSEYITSVKGHYGEFNFNKWVVVKSLKFETNLGSYGPYGDENGVPFELSANGGQIIGFHGRPGEYLDALGVYVKVKTTTDSSSGGVNIV
ncbi:agglutinin-like [Carex rostrata]